MGQGSVVLITDRWDRSRVLADTVRTMAMCRVVGADEPLFCFEPVIGIIADANLDRLELRQTLATLINLRPEPRVPLVVLSRTSSNASLRDATRLGATACFSQLTEPRAIVAALFQQIDPEKTIVDRLVEYSVARTGVLLGDMLNAARNGVIDASKLEEGIDPVIDAIRDGGLRRWLNLVQAHDDLTLRHCLLVAGLAAHFALHLGLSAEDRMMLVRAGLVHDVGKANIPTAILNKPGRLDPAEMEVIRTHPAAGEAILLASGMNDPLTLAATRHHHEMLDGSGYPDGLRGDQIGDAVRLLTICDIVAALIEHRPYRPPISQVEALKILRKMAIYGLEPALVEAFAVSVSGIDLTQPVTQEFSSVKQQRSSVGSSRAAIAWTAGRSGDRKSYCDPIA